MTWRPLDFHGVLGAGVFHSAQTAFLRINNRSGVDWQDEYEGPSYVKIKPMKNNPTIYIIREDHILFSIGVLSIFVAI